MDLYRIQVNENNGEKENIARNFISQAEMSANVILERYILIPHIGK